MKYKVNKKYVSLDLSRNLFFRYTEGNYELLYTYGYDQQRRISELKQNGNTIKTIVYQNNYEEISTGTITYSVHYIHSPDALVAMVVAYDSANIHYEKTYGVITDHLGSIRALYNTQGNIVWETSYDAWGRERNIAGADYSIPPARPVWLIRGYTGHEHLAEFGLINMNGRMYDPQIGRMLSPDNFVQSADATQAYNRYTYALNNPLRYKDPSGEFFVIDDLVAAAIGGVLNLGTNCLVPYINGFSIFELKKLKLWDRYYTEQPRRRTESEKKYKRLRRV